MKRYFSMVLTVIFVCMAVFIPMTVSAQNAVFTDTLEDNYPLVFDKSDMMRYEKNMDTGKTLYEKCSETGDFTTSEYVTYKLDDSVVSFSIDCMHVNGLGNADTDISVFVSNNNTDWVQVKTKSTKQTFDSDLYVNEDLAYWKLSTVTNMEKIEQGYTYIKIQINPFTVKDSVVWNTVIDTISVEYGNEVPADTSSNEEEISSDKEQQTEDTSDVQPSDETDKQSVGTDGLDTTQILLIVLIAVVIAAAVAIVLVITLKKNKEKGRE